MIILSFLGGQLRQQRIRGSRHLDGLLAHVWGYFRGAVLFILAIAAWPAVLKILHGNLVGGLIQIAVIGFMAYVVWIRFASLPQSWTELEEAQADELSHK